MVAEGKIRIDYFQMNAQEPIKEFHTIQIDLKQQCYQINFEKGTLMQMALDSAKSVKYSRYYNNPIWLVANSDYDDRNDYEEQITITSETNSLLKAIEYKVFAEKKGRAISVLEFDNWKDAYDHATLLREQSHRCYESLDEHANN